jgi:hypothetical protein
MVFLAFCRRRLARPQPLAASVALTEGKDPQVFVRVVAPGWFPDPSGEA